MLINSIAINKTKILGTRYTFYFVLLVGVGDFQVSKEEERDCVRKS